MDLGYFIPVSSHQLVFKMSDDAYMSMLNNPTINPPAGQAGANLEPVSQSRFEDPLGATATSIKQRLDQATDDLFYISESDEPFRFFNIPWKENQFPSVDQFISLVKDDELQEQEDDSRSSSSMEQFFEPLTNGDDPYNQAGQYVKLQDTFVESFGDKVKVYVFGAIELNIYITGLCEDGLVGVHTKNVQT
jgi:Nuclease A inhibitor-like protein